MSLASSAMFPTGVDLSRRISKTLASQIKGTADREWFFVTNLPTPSGVSSNMNFEFTDKTQESIGAAIQLAKDYSHAQGMPAFNL
jgi:hypothetical protein